VFHDHVFRSAAEDRVIANLGGIANITILKRNATIAGFDTGPANRMLDAWIQIHTGKDYDHDGAWAATGKVDQTLLEQLLDEPYLRLDPPKSTGRELFNIPWLKEKLGLFERNPADVQATLQELTAVSLTDAVKRYAPGASLYLCGGGAHNRALQESIARRVAPNRVATTQALGLDPDYVEAVAFAWFAKRTLEGHTSSAAGVTGAKGARILGGIYRYG
jgi:anhydro-N-acetylmuramic acid kinase